MPGSLTHLARFGDISGTLYLLDATATILDSVGIAGSGMQYEELADPLSLIVGETYYLVFQPDNAATNQTRLIAPFPTARGPVTIEFSFNADTLDFPGSCQTQPYTLTGIPGFIFEPDEDLACDYLSSPCNWIHTLLQLDSYT